MMFHDRDLPIPIRAVGQTSGIDEPGRNLEIYTWGYAPTLERTSLPQSMTG